MRYTPVQKQSGAVLAISLVLLSAITLLAAMNMQRAGLQTRIAANISHNEVTFNTVLSDQDAWFFDLSTTDLSNPILSAPIRQFNLDNGNRNYTPVVLNQLNQSGAAYAVQVDNQLIMTDPIIGTNALAEGEEVGNRVLFRYHLWSRGDLAGRNANSSTSEYQVSGISFPALNSSKNSLYSPP
jgi:ABC-type lipoprotein release transport system permease subunit